LPYAVQREELEPAFAGEWRALLPRAAMNKLFASPTWLRVWWQEFGGGRELILLSIRRDGELVGVAPLMRDGDRLGFAGDTQVCDYMDFIAAPGEEEAVLAAVLRSLGEEPWTDLTLWAVPEGSPTLEALKAVAPQFDLRVDIEVEDVCPQLELPATWGEYLAGLNKKDRHELRRKLRKLSQGGEVTLEALVEPAQVEAAIDDFLRLYRQSRTDKAAFMTEQMERFFRAIVSTLAAEGHVELLFLTLGGVRTAAVLCFCGGDQSLLYNSGYHPDYAYLSVGLLSKALALRKAIEEGKRRFDFLRGPEPYKYDLGARDVPVYRCTVRRN
jgi:CelD/BcsL family acetyltransferase involved in cellulose biosynthesis